MKEGWEIINFSDSIVNVIYSTKIKRKDFVEKGLYPVVSQEKELINGFWNNPKDLFNIKQPVIIFGDHTKAIKYVDFDFVLGADGVKILQPIEKIFPKYFYYFLSNIKIRDLGYSRHYRLLKAKKIYFPKLIIEQKRIVQILDKAFEAIDKSIANNEKNLQNTKELFDSYLNKIFSNPGEDWEVKKLGKMSVIKYGYTKSAAFDVIGPKFLRITDIQNGNVDWESVPYCKIDIIEINKYLLKEGDIVFARTGATTGKSYLIQGEIPKSVFASYLIRVQINISSLFPQYLYQFFQTKEYWNKISLGTSGSAQGGVNATKLAELQIPIPSLLEQQRIVSKLVSLSAETKRIESIYRQKLKNLVELKKSILQKAFNGEL